VWDLDNTLIRCGEYYIAAEEEFVELAYAETGLERDFCRKMIQTIDVMAASLPDGWNTWRMPAAYGAAMHALHALAGKHATVAVIAQAQQLAEDVFRAPYTPYPGVYEMLERFRSGGWLMVLCTKGDETLQNMKIDKHRLRGYFEHIYIVPRKGADVLETILAAHDIDPALSWYVGDSQKDDIAPACENGLMTIEVATGDGKWAYEDVDSVGHHEVTDVVQVLEILPAQAPVEGRTVPAGS
jgi:phosphoglycolate phosphatase-like HAD superfamily hydrolase